MLPYFYQEYGNPSSKHCMGSSASDAVARSREIVGSVIGASGSDVYFTGGATESCNMAIFGCVPDRKCHFVTSAIEHKAVLAPLKALEAAGHELTVVKPRQNGCVAASDIIRSLRPDTLLCSLMAVNNEVGTIQPFGEVASACRSRGILFHCDATQGYAKIPIDVSVGIDMLSLSGHKIYGPKGVGALYKSPHVALRGHTLGGSQEFGLRAGTLNVPGIVGLGVAAELSASSMVEFWNHASRLQSLFIENLQVMCRLNGCESSKVPWIINISIPNSDARRLTQIDGLCISKSSACAKSDEPSHVLESMGLDEGVCKCAIRVSFGRATTERDAIEAARMIRGSV